MKMTAPHRVRTRPSAVALLTLWLALTGALGFAQDAYTFDHPSWMWEEGAVGEWHKARLAEFQEANPHVTVEATLIPSNSFETTILTQLAAGDSPDLLPVFTNMIPPLVDAGLLAPLDECIANSDFGDRLLPSVDFAVYDGKTYGVPLTMSPQSLLYNQRLLDEVGMEVPTTVEEFYQAAKAIAEGTDADWGYAFNNDTANVLHTYINSMQWLLGFGSDWSQPDGTITANTEEAAEAIGWITRFLEEGISPRGLDSTTVRTMFAQGEVGFLIDGPWVLTQVKNDFPENYDDVGYAVAPTLTHAAITGGAFYTIPAGSEHFDDACAYLEVINTEENQRAWLEDLVQIPGTAVAPSDTFVSANPWMETMVEVAANYPGGLGYAPPGYAIQAAEFRQIVVDHLAQIYAGQKAVDEALNDLQDALERWAGDL